MSRNLIAGLLALVSAVVAGLLVYAYAANADQRAMADLSPTPVLVVTEAVPAGTAAEAMTDFVAVEEIPESAVIAGGISSLDDVEGQFTVGPLVPGEQLLAARFAAPEVLDAPDFEIPAGYHQVSFQLEARRVIGGHLKAGDTVGFFISDLNTETSRFTDLLFHKLLVTRVAGGAVEPTEDQMAQPPADTLMVTVAVDVVDAAKVIWAAEHTLIWLSLEPSDAPNDDPPTITAENLFR